jgi:hypothetical protein
MEDNKKSYLSVIRYFISAMPGSSFHVFGFDSCKLV